MHRKGSMELSVNSIVILVIAVVMMGLILGFIRSKFADVSGGFVVDESAALEASASNPITLSRNLVTVSGTKKTGLNINFYNTETRALTNLQLTVKPHFDCKNVGGGTLYEPVITGEYFNKTAKKSTMTGYSGNIKLSQSVPKDTYLCEVCFAFKNAVPYINDNAKCEDISTSFITSRKEFQLVVQ